MADLRWVDGAEDDGWEDLADLFTRRIREVLPDERATSTEEFRAGVRHQPAHLRSFQLLATEHGEPVGAAAFRMDDNRRESAWMLFLFVLPDWRGRGIGSSLLDAVREVVRAQGRTRIWTQTDVGAADGIRFAERARGRAGLVVEQARCPTAKLDRALLEAWCHRAAERAGGYSLVAFDDVCPDEHLDRYVAAIPIMNTAPKADTMEDYVPSREEVREMMVAMVRQGTRIWTLCARDDRSGEFVGYTELLFPEHRPWMAAQGDTGVHSDHRERGIGRWLKAHNALRLLADRPEVEFIQTWNAAANAAMLSINRAMGFEVVARRQEWQLPL
jgi:GNAT superfamily N-acetyltransferase